MVRRSSDELRTLLVEAGLRVLYRDGLRATASHVPMTAATGELARTHGIDVRMGSIFGPDRLWPNVAAFQLDLLRAAIEDTSSDGPNEQSVDLIAGLEEMVDRPFAERIERMVELCRIAGRMNGYVRRGTSLGRTWDLWIGIWATATSADDAGEALKPALRAELDRTSERFEVVYRMMLDKLRLRLRPPYTLRQLTTLAAAVTDGIALRAAVSDVIPAQLASPRNSEPWTLLGVGLAAIVTEMLEDDAG